jgi:hypothetical protein
MVTTTSPLARQPDKLDYASPTQFRFGIHQLPKVEFFTTAINLPGISLGIATLSTPYKDIPLPGEKLEYGNLSIEFLVDEYLENYISLHNWMTGLGFPQDREEFKTYRDVTSNTPTTPTAAAKSDIKVGTATPDRAMFSDAFIMILSNKNNPILEINFEDIFPVSIGDLDYSQAATDVEYLSVSAEFAYKIYTMTAL